MLEALEQRQLMSVSIGTIGDALYITGDQYNNGISVDQVGSNLVVKEYQGAAGYQTIHTVASSSIGSIQLWGYDGNDTLSISDNVQQDATILGGRGADFLQAGGGTTTLYGQGKSNSQGVLKSMYDDGAADTLVAGSGVAFLFGQSGNDTLYFGGNHQPGTNHTGDGGAGNDTFHVKGSRSIVALGGGGNDTFFVYGDALQASLHGGSGADTADYRHYGYGATVSHQAPSGHIHDASKRKQTIHDDVEHLTGTPFADSITGNNSANNLLGLGGDDMISGNGGNDMVDGGTGNDTLFGNHGNDIILGQAGNDGIDAGPGNDTVAGHAGNDNVWGREGNDLIYGGTGNDTLRGDEGNDQIYGEAGHDHLYAGAGYNKLVGGSGSDYLYAVNGSWYDLLFGDNEGGSGALSGDYDVAVIDQIFYQGQMYKDLKFGIESA